MRMRLLCQLLMDGLLLWGDTKASMGRGWRRWGWRGKRNSLVDVVVVHRKVFWCVASVRIFMSERVEEKRKATPRFFFFSLFCSFSGLEGK